MTQKDKRQIYEDSPQFPDREAKIGDRYYFAHLIWYQGYVEKIFLRLYGIGGFKNVPRVCVCDNKEHPSAQARRLADCVSGSPALPQLCLESRC